MMKKSERCFQHFSRSCCCSRSSPASLLAQTHSSGNIPAHPRELKYTQLKLHAAQA